MSHTVVQQVTKRIVERSRPTRERYLERIDAAGKQGPHRTVLSCSNLAHGIAACGAAEKTVLSGDVTPNIGIVTAYNDMLSAHQPYEQYPEQIRRTAVAAGATAQVAGGVPAMCDGITQGQPGMDLSLFSRDLIAMGTGVALSHNMFDAVLCLGICDKIVPGLLIGSLSFGHLPTLFVPAGPMPSGLPNKEKAQVREAYAAGDASRDDLIAAESAAYHSPGTCTFYGTANSNQMLMEFMGLQLPGGSFINPGTDLRSALTDQAVHQVLSITQLGNNYQPLGRIVCERSIVNAVVGLLATGGSTNHSLHLVAIAAAAGIDINWDDFSELSAVIPQLAQVYPNGQADVNDFRDAGGLGFVMHELLQAGLLHDEVPTILGEGLSKFTVIPSFEANELAFSPATRQSADHSVVRAVSDPFQNEGGLTLVQGNLGRAITKVSAVTPEHRRVCAPARVFSSQDTCIAAFEAGEINKDVVIVLRHQGPRANGMPELHKLTPYMGVLQNTGAAVALLTDGRMSGASGKILAAIQLTPEALDDGPIGKLQDGDIIEIDANNGLLSTTADLDSREQASPCEDSNFGLGRELFAGFRQRVGTAETGASQFDTL